VISEFKEDNGDRIIVRKKTLCGGKCIGEYWKILGETTITAYDGWFLKPTLFENQKAVVATEISSFDENILNNEDDDTTVVQSIIENDDMLTENNDNNSLVATLVDTSSATAVRNHSSARCGTCNKLYSRTNWPTTDMPSTNEPQLWHCPSCIGNTSTSDSGSVLLEKTTEGLNTISTTFYKHN
jgi:hypothetical protein